MKKLVVIGNWKSHKTIRDAVLWFDKFNQSFKDINLDTSLVEIIICAPFIHLPVLKDYQKKNKMSLSVKLAAQNVSAYNQGAYTGEIGAFMLKNIVEYSLIGHSERRDLFHETDKVIAQKAERLLENSITPILCVPDVETNIHSGIKIVAYEPVWAIGSGKPATPQHAEDIARKLKERGVKTVIYGGSVTPDNIKGFVTQQNIDGVLPGGASLDPRIFSQLIIHAQE